jgi:hypothetical protein
MVTANSFMVASAWPKPRPGAAVPAGLWLTSGRQP